MEVLSLEAYFRVILRSLSFDVKADATPYDHLVEELGFDSLQLLELIIMTEVLSEVLIPPDEPLEAFDSFAHAYDYYVMCARVAAQESQGL